MLSLSLLIIYANTLEGRKRKEREREREKKAKLNFNESALRSPFFIFSLDQAQC